MAYKRTFWDDKEHGMLTCCQFLWCYGLCVGAGHDKLDYYNVQALDGMILFFINQSNIIKLSYRNPIPLLHLWVGGGSYRGYMLQFGNRILVTNNVRVQESKQHIIHP